MTRGAVIATHELDLLDNALDSLAEALAKFEEGDDGEPKAYKFAVLHMAHFIELIFKHHVAEKHPLLIYKESKMTACNKEAGDKKGDERKAFMKECLSAKKVTPQQAKMKTCNAEAKDMKGDARKKFMSDCLKK
jgi:hypothetical protein